MELGELPKLDQLDVCLHVPLVLRVQVLNERINRASSDDQLSAFMLHFTRDSCFFMVNVPDIRTG
jgi:hypothetical protein